MSGAYLNRVWRLEIDGRAYAVKVLNPRFLAPDLRREYEATISLEWAALLAGVPTARPVPAVDGGWLVELPVGLVRVHEWVEGRQVGEREVEPSDASQAGAMLARIHALDVRRPVRPEELLRRRTVGDWSGPAVELPELAPLLAVVERVNEVVVAGRALLRRPVLSHADVSAKNLLRRPDGCVVLLDWDAARAKEPCLEVAAAAVNLSGVARGRPRPDVLRAFVDGYRGAGGSFAGGDRRILAGMLDGMLGWIWLNYRRATNGATQAARRDGRRRAARAVRELVAALDELDGWAAELSR